MGTFYFVNINFSFWFPIMITILLQLTILEGTKMSECLEITAIVR